MIHIYGIPNCNTVKKALDWLDENKKQYTFHNFKKEGVTQKQLENWSKVFGWENLLNKAGTTWKKLPEDEKAKITNKKAAFELMMKQNSVIKRPIVEAGDNYLVRFNDEEYKNLLG